VRSVGHCHFVMGTVPSLDVVVKGGFGTLFVQFGQLEDRL